MKGLLLYQIYIGRVTLYPRACHEMCNVSGASLDLSDTSYHRNINSCFVTVALNEECINTKREPVLSNYIIISTYLHY